MANSVDPDETAHHELSHLDPYCLQTICFACRTERVEAELPLLNIYIFFV